jgi:hypothetical protein
MKEGRRKFLWQVGGLIAGLTGLSRLARAMSSNDAAVSSDEPCSVVPWNCNNNYTCDQFGGITCQNGFNCVSTFTCGPTWFGDFKCEQLEFSCGNFQCITYGGEPGAQFHCLARFANCNIFKCDPGDFSCEEGKHYSCSSTTLSTAYAVSIVPPES